MSNDILCRFHLSYSVNGFVESLVSQLSSQTKMDAGERTDLVVRASASGSGDPGSILGRVGVLFP